MAAVFLYQRIETDNLEKTAEIRERVPILCPESFNSR